jgi:hypothetical protein
MRHALIPLLLAGAIPGRAAPATFSERVAPVLENRCTTCHGPTKQKGGLRLDSPPAILLGGEDGAVVRPGDAPGSELIRRILLPPDDDDHMPPAGKSPPSPADVALLQAWIAAGAPATALFEPAGFAPALPAAPDYRPRLAAATELARTLGVRLLPRSRVPTDGLVLRAASAPRNCDDRVLDQLAPFADLIVDAELARTRVTDRGLEAVGRWVNLAHLDLTHTTVTSDGLAHLQSLRRLETLNLTATQVDSRGLALARTLPALKNVWAFEPH